MPGAAREKEEGVSQPQRQSVPPFETGHWWALALRGVIAILFGLAAFLRPGIALEALILLFGAYALVDGIFSVVGGSGAQGRGRRAGCCSSKGWLAFWRV